MKKMNNEIDLSFESAMKQSVYTAEHFLISAVDVLFMKEFKYSTSDAIALAHIMQMDFNATVTNIKLQELRDVIKDMGDALTEIAGKIEEK